VNDLEKEIIIAPEKIDERSFKTMLSRGIKSLYTDPEKVPEKLRSSFKIYWRSSKADIDIVSSLEDLKSGKGFQIVVEDPEDIEKILAASKAGASAIIVETRDWRIIPLENLVAELQGSGTKLIAVASDPGEVELLSGVLERGVDGIILKIADLGSLDPLLDYIKAPRRVELGEAVVTEVRDVGLGDRACIDTTSILELGEGMLVGNTASLLALIHNESMGSSFTSPRPFRVNAGAIHSYILMPDGSTRYLSELSSGDRVLVVSRDGRTKIASIGRVKIERRPLRVVKLRLGDVDGSVTVQNAETIRLIKRDGSLIPVTDLKRGDKILAHRAPPARHFGKAVEEFIIER